VVVIFVLISMLRPSVGSYVEVFDDAFVSLPHIKAIENNNSKDYVTLWNLKRKVRKQQDEGANTLGVESKLLPTASEKLIELNHVFYSHVTQKLKFRTVGVIKELDYGTQRAKVRLLLEKNQFVQGYNIDKDFSFSNLRVVSRAEFKILFKQPFISEQLIKKASQAQVREEVKPKKLNKTKRDQSLLDLEKPIVKLHRRVLLDENDDQLKQLSKSRKTIDVKEMLKPKPKSTSQPKIDAYLMDMREEMSRGISQQVISRTVSPYNQPKH
jgi:hypothetical protein